MDSSSIEKLGSESTLAVSSSSLSHPVKMYYRGNPSASVIYTGIIHTIAHKEENPASAIRSGDWKLIHFYESDTYELYNLMSDPEETTDLASLKLDLVDELKTELENYLNSIGASFPKAKE